MHTYNCLHKFDLRANKCHLYIKRKDTAFLLRQYIWLH